MKNKLLKVSPLAFLLLSFSIEAQAPAYNQNSARSNNAKVLMGDAWEMGVAVGLSSGMNSDESTLFRGNGFSTKVFANYYLGQIGFGISSGLMSGDIDENAVNSFLTDRKISTDQATLTSSEASNSYFLFGPTAKYGKRVLISASVQGGVFLNNPGSLSVSVLDASGVNRIVYGYTNVGKNTYFGFSENINVHYPINKSTHIFINSEFIQTKTSVLVKNLQNGIDKPVEQNRDIRLMNFGFGISKTLGEKGNSTAQRVLPTVNKREIAIDEPGVHFNEVVAPRDAASGQSSGKTNAQYNPKEYNLDKTYRPGRPVFGNRTTENCGPVTVKETRPDGTTEEKTFACPEDAAQYQKQTQAQSFGEKVNSGLAQTGDALANGAQRSTIIHRDLAARNILVGRVQLHQDSPSGIVTNTSNSVSSLSGLGGGASAASYAATGRMASPSGTALTLYARESASGKASGISQNQLVYYEQQGSSIPLKGGLATVKSNPLYEEKGNSGTNPLYEDKSRTASGEGSDCEGFGGFTVNLVDANNGTVVATTQTESCGEFYFANVPSGDYVVKLSGTYLSKKGYDYYAARKQDVVGKIVSTDYWSIDYTTGTGTPEDARALLKTKTKSNQSNDRIGSSDGLIWSPKSNKMLNVAVGDLDGDGASDLMVGSFGEKVNQGLHAAGGALAQGASLVGGSLPGGAVISAVCSPGNPISGLSVKGGKNPGGNLRTTQTDENGEFVFTDWKEGSYQISTEVTYYLNDETFVSLGDEESTGSDANESKTKGGIVKVTATQNSQSLRSGQVTQNSQSLKSGINNINSGMPNRISMNVTVPKQTQGATFGEKVSSNPDELNGPTMKAQNNNTVRSNRTDNAIIMADLDGDGSMDSSYLNFKGEVATISITEPGMNYSGGANTAGGINITEPGTPKTITAVGPVKWMAPEVISKKVWGDPHVDQKSGGLKLGSGNSKTLYDGKWKCEDVCLKAVKCNDGVVVVLTGKGNDFPSESKISLNGLPPGQPVKNAQFVFVDENGKTYTTQTDTKGKLSLNGLPPGVPLQMLANFGIDGNDDIIITFTTDATGFTTVSNVLKTKHDTVKNSINNVR